MTDQERLPFNARYLGRGRGRFGGRPETNSRFADEAVERTREAINELSAVLETDRLIAEIERVQQGAPMPPPLRYRRSNRGDPGE